MPLLNRLRLININVDHDQKRYPDVTMEYWGFHGLNHLVNGGGKTVTLGLITATVLPPEPAAGREFFGKLLNGNRQRVSYCLTEWRLDQPGRYLLTGLAFALGEDGPRWINFTVTYQDHHPFDLAHLPVKDGQNMISFEQLRRVLAAAAKEHDIRVFRHDQRGEYFRHMETFRHFRREWEMIARSNQTEGGLPNVFLQYKTSRRLLEEFIIPQIAGTIGAGDRQDDSLAALVAGHMAQVAAIPELRRKKAAYTLLADRSGQMLTALGDVLADRRAFAEVCCELRAVEQHAEADAVVLSDRLAALERAVGELGSRLQGNLWQQASLKIARKQADLERLQADLMTFRERLEEAIDEVRRLQQQRTLALAWGQWERYKQLWADAHRLWTEIEAYGAGDPELEAWLAAARANVKAHLLVAHRQAEQALQAAMGRVDEAEHQAKDKEMAVQEDSRQLGVLQGQQKALSGEAEQQARQRRQHEQLLDREALDHPDSSLPVYQHRHEQQQQQVLLLRQTVQETREQREQALMQAAQHETAVATSTAEATAHEQALERLLQACAGAVKRLQEAGYPEGAEHLFAAALPTKLEEQATAIQAQLEALGLEKDGEERRTRWLSGDRATLNPDAENVQRFLADQGIDAMDGLAWLTAQVPDAEQRNRILAVQPLLPYGLVLSERDHLRVSQHPAWFAGVFLESPVPLFARRPGLIDADPGVQPDFLLPMDKGWSVFAVADDRAGLLQEAQDGLNALSRRIKTLQERSRSLQRAQLAVVELQRAHHPQEETQLRTAHAQAREKAMDAAETAARLRQSAADLQQEIAVKGSQLAQAEALSQETGNQVTTLAHWLPSWQRLMAIERERESLRATEQKLVADIAYGKQQLEAHQAALRECQRTRDACQRQVQAAAQELGALAPVEAAEAPVGSLDEARAQMEGLLRRLEQKNSNLADMRQRHQELTTAADRVRQGALDLGVSAEQIAAIQTPPEPIEAYDRSLVSAGKFVGQRQAEVEDCLRKISRLEGAIESEARQVLAAFGKEPAELQGHIDALADELQRDEQAVRQEMVQLQKRQAGLQAESQEVTTALAALRALSKTYPATVAGAIDWPAIRPRVAAYASELGERLKLARDKMDKTDGAFARACKAFAVEMAATGVEQIAQLAEQFAEPATLVRDGTVILQGLGTAAREAVESIETNLQVHERSLGLTVENCLMRTRAISEALRELVRYTQVKLPGEEGRRRLLTVELAAPPADEAAHMETHLLSLTEKLQSLPKDRWPDTIADAIEPAQLLHVMHDLSRSTVKVAKLTSAGVSVQDPWEVVVKGNDRGGWSGAEEYLGALSVYLAVNTYVRNRLAGNDRSPKFLLADNPFGKTQAEHFLGTIRQLLDSTGTQWLCTTDIRDHRIYETTDIHYSFTQNPLGGTIWFKQPEREIMNPARFHMVGAPDPLHGPGAGPGDQPRFGF